MVVKTAAELHDFVSRILLAAGVSEENANRVAEALVSSNRCGVDTHGIWNVPGYVTAIQAGEIQPRSHPARPRLRRGLGTRRPRESRARRADAGGDPHRGGRLDGGHRRGEVSQRPGPVTRRGVSPAEFDRGPARGGRPPAFGVDTPGDS